MRRTDQPWAKRREGTDAFLPARQRRKTATTPLLRPRYRSRGRGEGNSRTSISPHAQGSGGGGERPEEAAPIAVSRQETLINAPSQNRDFNAAASAAPPEQRRSQIVTVTASIQASTLSAQSPPRCAPVRAQSRPPWLHRPPCGGAAQYPPRSSVGRRRPDSPSPRHLDLQLRCFREHVLQCAPESAGDVEHRRAFSRHALKLGKVFCRPWLAGGCRNALHLARPIFTAAFRCTSRLPPIAHPYLELRCPPLHGHAAAPKHSGDLRQRLPLPGHPPQCGDIFIVPCLTSTGGHAANLPWTFESAKGSAGGKFRAGPRNLVGKIRTKTPRGAPMPPEADGDAHERRPR